MRRFFSTLFKKQGGVYTPLRVLDLDGDAGAGGLGLATPTQAGLMSVAKSGTHLAITVDQTAENTVGVAFTSGAAAATLLAVSVTGLADGNYRAKVGARLAAWVSGAAGTAASTGGSDHTIGCHIAVSSGVASFTFGTISNDTADIPSGWTSYAAAIVSSPGGFTVQLTQSSGSTVYAKCIARLVDVVALNEA